LVLFSGSFSIKKKSYIQFDVFIKTFNTEHFFEPHLDLKRSAASGIAIVRIEFFWYW